MEGRAIAEVDALDQIELDHGAEVLGMFFHAFDQLGSAQAIGEARVIFDFVGDGDLPAQAELPSDDDGRQLGAGGIERRGQTGGTGTYDDNAFLFHTYFLVKLAVRRIRRGNI